MRSTRSLLRTRTACPRWPSPRAGRLRPPRRRPGRPSRHRAPDADDPVVRLVVGPTAGRPPTWWPPPRAGPAPGRPAGAPAARGLARRPRRPRGLAAGGPAPPGRRGRSSRCTGAGCSRSRRPALRRAADLPRRDPGHAAWGRPAHGSPSVRIAVVDSGVDVTHPDLAGKVPGPSTRSSRAPGCATWSATAPGWPASRRPPPATASACPAPATTAPCSSSRSPTGPAGSSPTTWRPASSGPPTAAPTSSTSAWAARRRTGWRRRRRVRPAQGRAGRRCRRQRRHDHPAVPGALPGVLGVGATTVNGAARAPFSSYGPWVDVAAPGRSIVLASPGGGYERADGTSFSAPLVAGEAALLAAFRPGRTADELRQAAITGGATPASSASPTAWSTSTRPSTCSRRPRSPR